MEESANPAITFVMIFIILPILFAIISIPIIIFLRKHFPTPKISYSCSKCGKKTEEWEVIEDPLYQWGNYQFITVCKECAERIRQFDDEKT